jgi:hypothetical protein
MSRLVRGCANSSRTTLQLLVDYRDRGEAVGALGRSVLERELAGVRKQHVDNYTLGRG